MKQSNIMRTIYKWTFECDDDDMSLHNRTGFIVSGNNRGYHVYPFDGEEVERLLETFGCTIEEKPEDYKVQSTVMRSVWGVVGDLAGDDLSMTLKRTMDDYDDERRADSDLAYIKANL